MKTLAPAVPSVLILGTQWQVQWLVQLAFRQDLLSRRPMPFPNRTRQVSVCGPKPTQPLQPGVAPRLATTLVVKYTRRCPDGPLNGGPFTGLPVLEFVLWQPNKTFSPIS